MNIDPTALGELKNFFSGKNGDSAKKLTVTAAYKLGQQEKISLLSFLKKQEITDFELIEEVDRSILGGLIIVAGTTVIDLSLRGRLANLKKDIYALT